jgi:tetratricopeptide (TPR) repeat protein
VRAELCADERTRPTEGELAAIETIAPAVFCERAWKVYEHGDLTRARSLIETVVAEHGRIPWALHLLAWLHHRSGASDVAEQYLDEAIASGVCPYAEFDRAVGRLDQSRYQDAERDAISFLRQVNGDELAMEHGVRLLERVWEAAKRADHGAEVLGGLTRELDRSPSLWVSRAAAECAMGRPDEASRCLDRALALAPDHPLATRRKLEWSGDRDPCAEAH